VRTVLWRSLVSIALRSASIILEFM